jgi:oligoribonuclease
MTEWALESICWLDVETTGLDHQSDLMLEIAMIVTTRNLHEVARRSLVIAHTAEAIEAAFARSSDQEGAAYVREMHTKNGLIKECQGPGAVPLAEADVLLAEVLSARRGEGAVLVPLGGSSTHLDRAMVRRDLPRLYSHLHHRSVDASCLKLALVNWAGVEPKRSQASKDLHRALHDIESSVKLARCMKLHLQRAKRGALQLVQA